jgi:hypothetical protein
MEIPVKSKNLLWTLGLALIAAMLTMAKAQTTIEVKPFLHIPEDVSPEFQAYLRTQKDPALMPRFPDPSDLDSWKKVYEGMPHNFATRVPEAPESKVARKKIADFARKYLGDAPGSGR